MKKYIKMVNSAYFWSQENCVFFSRATPLEQKFCNPASLSDGTQLNNWGPSTKTLKKTVCNFGREGPIFFWNSGPEFRYTLYIYMILKYIICLFILGDSYMCGSCRSCQRAGVHSASELFVKQGWSAHCRAGCWSIARAPSSKAIEYFCKSFNSFSPVKFILAKYLRKCLLQNFIWFQLL